MKRAEPKPIKCSEDLDATHSLKLVEHQSAEGGVNATRTSSADGMDQYRKKRMLMVCSHSEQDLINLKRKQNLSLNCKTVETKHSCLLVLVRVLIQLSHVLVQLYETLAHVHT